MIDAIDYAMRDDVKTLLMYWLKTLNAVENAIKDPANDAFEDAMGGFDDAFEDIIKTTVENANDDAIK